MRAYQAISPQAHHQAVWIDVQSLQLQALGSIAWEAQHGKHSMGSTAWEAQHWEAQHGKHSMGSTSLGSTAWEAQHGKHSTGKHSMFPALTGEEHIVYPSRGQTALACQAYSPWWLVAYLSHIMHPAA